MNTLFVFSHAFESPLKELFFLSLTECVTFLSIGKILGYH